MIDRLRQPSGVGLRALGSTWFLLLALTVASNWWSDRTAGGATSQHLIGWPLLLTQGGIALFYLTLWLLVLIRPNPVARTNRTAPNALAFIGTYMPWLIPLLPRQHLPDAGYVVAAGLILGGNALTLFVIWHLGRSFSIVPQARKLVTAGPYALIRHPLYLAEELMVVGTALLYTSPSAVMLVIVHALIQVRRMLYEEQVLTGAFPGYRDYARRTRRLVPCLW